MSNFRRILVLLLSVVMLFTMLLPLAACSDDVDEPCVEHVDANSDGKCDECGVDVEPEDACTDHVDSNNDGKCDECGASTVTEQVGNALYTVEVKSVGGMPLSDITVYVHNKDDFIVKYAKTDANGVAKFELPRSTEYTAELSGVPEGYTVSDRYAFSATGVKITLVSKLVGSGDERLDNVSLKLGDVMYDFEVTTPDGVKYKLSELLKTKKAVVLNFWYTTCTYCVQEFPYMNSAYQAEYAEGKKYSDDIEIIAINDYASDNEISIKNFQEDYGLTFPMVKDTVGLQNAFGFEVNPCSVVIDRYGVITLIEIGAVIGERYFTNTFDHFIAENYEQKLLESFKQLSPIVKPNVEMPTSAEIENSFEVDKDSVRAEYFGAKGNDTEYSWPFITSEYSGESCIKPSNFDVDNSFATLRFEIELNAGEAVVFDYFCSTQARYDIFYVLVDGKDIYSMSGVEDEDWQTCCAYVAETAGTYEVTFCYIKDSTDKDGDDTVYLKDLRVVGSEDIPVEAYIFRFAATGLTDDKSGYKNYVNVVYNEQDGYYHVGDVNGPLLLANMLGYTNFDSDKIVTERLYSNETFMLNGENVFNSFELYCNYASNSDVYGYTPVTAEFKDILVAYVELYRRDVGKAANDNLWLQLCAYYSAYGPEAKELEDPIKGLASFSAFTAETDKKNVVEYNKVIMPRGYLYKFVPSESGVYRIVTDSALEVDGWIFTGSHSEWALLGDRVVYADSDEGERYVPDLLIDPDGDGIYERDFVNCSMVAYLEEGKTYYIVIAYYDVYAAGKFTFEIAKIGDTFDMFCEASPGPFTFDIVGADQIGDTIAGGIDVALCTDPDDERYGYYCHKLEDGSLGSVLYADFEWTTNIFTTRTLRSLIDSGAFNFKMSETDHQALGYLQSYSREELEILWGATFEENWYNVYKMDDIIAGNYHGRGTEDATETVKTYLDKMLDENDHPERAGCVMVDEQLAGILQQLMDKFTFPDVDHSWTKLCYYYKHLG